MPSVEQRDVRALLMIGINGCAFACGFRMRCNRSHSVMDCAEGRDCEDKDGQLSLLALSLSPHTDARRNELMTWARQLEADIEVLDRMVS